MHRTARWALPLLLLLALSPLLHGCRSVTTFPSLDSRPWNGLGASFVLPTDVWCIQETEDVQGRHFASCDGYKQIVFFTKPADEKVPVWISLRDAVLDFRDKELVERRTVQFSSGRTAEYARYLVHLEGADMPLDVWALREKGRNFVFIAWNSAGGPIPDMRPSLDSLSVLETPSGEKG